MSGDQPSKVEQWLATLGLEKHAPMLERHDIDLDTLADLSDLQLSEIGIPLGACLRIRKALSRENLRTPTSQLVAERHIFEALAQVASERRQVTVMFCDMVGSSRLANELDPEDMRRLLLKYWDVIEAVAAEYQGYIAQHLGDGALIYFGFPAAGENDAERAILAGLQLLKAMSDTSAGLPATLQVRLGLATGTVVINQFKGSGGKIETLAIGQSVNFAARLQSVAVPGSLVTDELTRALVGGLVTFEPLGAVAVEGFDAPALLFKVLGVARVRSRYEAQRLDVRSSLLGRDDEMAFALENWRACARSEGRLLLITGEPGIGKSRLVLEVMAWIGTEAFTSVHSQCSPHNASSPLYPIIESLSMMADLDAAPSVDERRLRLDKLLASDGQTPALLLDLFNQSAAAATGDPHERRMLTLTALVEFFAGLCSTAPLLFIVEDLHWCDPTTLEFLEQLQVRAQTLPVLILATARPETQHRFGQTGNFVTLPLLRFSRDLTDALVRDIFDKRAVSAQLLDIVADRTDGVPLFVEELLKSLDESGAIIQVGASVKLSETIDRGAIPRSLQSILMARLDMLGGAKRIVQIASCIGRQFTWDLLMAVAHLSAADLLAALEQSAASELIVAGPPSPFLAFTFRHALVCDAAYHSLLFSERQSIHGEIAAVLAASDPPTRPEILAHHLTSARRLAAAIKKWCEAGEAAKLRSANAEAIDYLERALLLVTQTPAEAARDELELVVLLALIAPMRAAHGFAAADVAKLTERAIALADKARDARRILPLLYNRWVYSFVTADRETCRSLAQDIMDRSTFDDTGLLRMTGLRAIAATQFTAGHFRQAAANFDASIAIYDRAGQSDLTHAVGLDGMVTALGYCSLARWCLGDKARAHHQAGEALAAARRIAHASTIIFATYHEALLAGVLERNAGVLNANGLSLQQIGRDHGFAMWLICGQLLESLGACLENPDDTTISAAEKHFVDFENMGVVYRPTYHAFLAEVCLAAGDVGRGLRHLHEAAMLIGKTGERWNESELFRLEGALTPNLSHARTCFNKALEIAHAQHAVAWEERARTAMDLRF